MFVYEVNKSEWLPPLYGTPKGFTVYFVRSLFYVWFFSKYIVVVYKTSGTPGGTSPARTVARQVKPMYKTV